MQGGYARIGRGEENGEVCLITQDAQRGEFKMYWEMKEQRSMRKKC